jgi:hypothetical protein
VGRLVAAARRFRATFFAGRRAAFFAVRRAVFFFFAVRFRAADLRRPRTLLRALFERALRFAMPSTLPCPNR